MDIETSAYQAFKLWLAGYLPVDRNTLHVLIGAILFAGAAICARHRRSSAPFAVALTAALVLAIAMEPADLRDDMATLGRWRWQASLLDMVRTIAIPLAGYLLVLGVRKRGGKPPPR